MRASTEKRARKAKALDKRVERMEAGRTQVDKRDRASKFKLPTPPRSGAIPLEVAKLGVRYGSNEVLSDVTFHAGRGDHIVIIGRNGAGKSSLLRCLAGVQEPIERRGRARGQRRGRLLRPGARADRPDRSALDNVSDAVLKAEKDRRALLGSFGLPSKAADQLPATLSGGERAKLGLAMLSAGEANLLLLDEPTNNLDPSSIAAVGAMLGAWPGTIVAVSHERGFVEALAPDLLPAPARGALHPLARGVPRRRRDALRTSPAEAGYDIQICVGQSTPSSKATALEPCSVVGLAKFCTLGLATTAQVSRASQR